MARTCKEMFGYTLITAPYISIAPMALTVLMMVLGGRSLRRCRDVAIRSWLESVVGQRLEGSAFFEIVVLDSPLAQTHSVPGGGAVARVKST